MWGNQVQGLSDIPDGAVVTLRPYWGKKGTTIEIMKKHLAAS